MTKIKGPFRVYRGTNRIVDGNGISFAFGACVDGNAKACAEHARRIAKALNAMEAKPVKKGARR